MVVDVGFDRLPDATDVVTGPDLLRFAGIEPVRCFALQLELQIAEKVHAYTKRYGRDQIGSMRTKDLVDIALIASLSPHAGDRLLLAIADVFGQRGTHALPARLPQPDPDWRVPYGALAREVGLAAELDRGYEIARTLIDPVLRDEVHHGQWDPGEFRWR